MKTPMIQEEYESISEYLKERKILPGSQYPYKALDIDNEEEQKICQSIIKNCVRLIPEGMVTRPIDISKFLSQCMGSNIYFSSMFIDSIHDEYYPKWRVIDEHGYVRGSGISLASSIADLEGEGVKIRAEESKDKNRYVDNLSTCLYDFSNMFELAVLLSHQKRALRFGYYIDRSDFYVDDDAKMWIKTHAEAYTSLLPRFKLVDCYIDTEKDKKPEMERVLKDFAEGSIDYIITNSDKNYQRNKEIVNGKEGLALPPTCRVMFEYNYTVKEKLLTILALAESECKSRAMSASFRGVDVALRAGRLNARKKPKANKT